MNKTKGTASCKPVCEETGAAGRRSGRIPILSILFLLVLVFAIGFRIYKADFAGITYDERANFRLFAQNLFTAVNVFTTTNNHVLNSVLMYYAHEYFAYYDHFIRIPSLLAGILFTLSLAYIVHRTISSKAIRVAALAMISLIPFVVDYSFMARGYSYAMGACFVQIALVVWLIEHKIRYGFWLLPVMAISLMNFVAFGAMLSSLLILGAFNLIFVFFYSDAILRPKDIADGLNDHNDSSRGHRVKRIHRRQWHPDDADVRKVSLFEKKWFPIALNLTSVFLISSTLLYLLYKNIYQTILNNRTLARIARRFSGWSGFVDYLHDLLVTRVFVPKRTPGNIILTVILLLLAVAVLFHLYRFCRAVKKRQWRRYINRDDPAVFIFAVTALTMLFMFIQCVWMGKGLGLARNHVFMIPLVLLCGLILLDRFGCAFRGRITRRFIQGAVAIVVLAAMIHNFPSPYHIARQGMAGPLLRKLRDIDPDRVWNIGFTEKTKNRSVGFWYYKRNFGHKYKCRLLQPDKADLCDLLIQVEGNQPVGRALFEWRFFKPQKYVIVVNTQLPTDKVIYSACLIED